MNILFKLKKQAKGETAISHQSSSQEPLLRHRRSLSTPYSLDSTNHTLRSALSGRPSTSHSDYTDSRSVSLHNPFSDPDYEEPEEGPTGGEPVTSISRVHAMGTTVTDGTPTKTLFISSRGFGKKVVFSTTPSLKTEMDNIVAYIETPGYYSWGASNWSALVYRDQPNHKPSVAGSGEREGEREMSPLFAKATRSSFWKKMVIEFVNHSENSEAGIIRIEVNVVPGLVQRGYTFTLPGPIGGDGHRKEYRWSGTRMYSKAAGFADLKLVDPDTKQILATFEKKWSFSSFIAPETRVDKGKLNNHGRDPVGCLHIFESNVPNEMNELIIILTGYCVIEAENRKREGMYM